MNSAVLTTNPEIAEFIEILKEKAKEDLLVVEMVERYLDLAPKLNKQEEAELVKRCEAHKGKYAEIIGLITSHPKY